MFTKSIREGSNGKRRNEIQHIAEIIAASNAINGLLGNPLCTETNSLGTDTAINSNNEYGTTTIAFTPCLVAI
ncbi:hypothetical protein [Photobacterium kishitanii]|uniref:hypothetical protein n=1 Tax=Photobacterium kishitanii TaxID=318456 RepID=UPI002738A10D|nr:hypothetical protein [Photobacterium kishitanii]